MELERNAVGGGGGKIKLQLNEPLDSSSEEEMREKQVAEQKKKEVATLRIAAKSKIVSRMVKAFSNNSYFKMSLKHEQMIEHGKRIAEKILKHSEEKIIEAQLMSKKFRKLIERLDQFPDISRKLEQT